MQALQEKWEERGYGTIIGSQAGMQRLTYAMFADDTTLISKSRFAMTTMLEDLMVALGDLGLNLNADKCSVQCSHATMRPRSPIKIQGAEFKILSRDEGFRVLGTMFTLNGSSDVEIGSRLAAARAKFAEMKNLLCKKDSNVGKRCLLFEAPVSKTALWCAESWALTVKQKKHIRATQRSMLRTMLGPARMQNEEYIPWIKRATKIAEARAREGGIKCWISTHLQMKWRWASKISNMPDERWAKRTILWRDSVWQLENGTSSSRPMRSRSGNMMRWENELRRFAEYRNLGNWQFLSPEEWSSNEEAFVRYSWR